MKNSPYIFGLTRRNVSLSHINIELSWNDCAFEPKYGKNKCQAIHVK